MSLIFDLGKIFYLNLPNPQLEIGYYLYINGAKVQFQDLTLIGDPIYNKGDEKKWYKNLPKVDHAMQKLLVLPFY